MQTYLCSFRWTDSGILDLQQTATRRATAKHKAEKLGITIKEIYVTSGETDMLYILEAPDAASVAKLTLLIAAAGNVRTRTSVAFSSDQFDKMLKELSQLDLG